jgi:hypothetical protein
MAGDMGGKAAEHKIAEGMADAGKGEKGKAGGDAAKGQRGHGSDPTNVGRDMAESGSGTAGKREESDQGSRA